MKWKGREQEYQRDYMRDYRKRHKGDTLRTQNRLGFLEHEVERLQKCLTQKASVPPVTTHDNGDDLSVVVT